MTGFYLHRTAGGIQVPSTEACGRYSIWAFVVYYLSVTAAVLTGSGRVLSGRGSFW